MAPCIVNEKEFIAPIFPLFAAKAHSLGAKTRLWLKAADPGSILRAIPHMATEGTQP